MSKVKYKVVGDGYECIEDFVYYSPRYKQFVTVHNGFYSDGATGARDLDSDSWWVHDVLCRYGVWNSGDKVSNWQASQVLHDILDSEGYVIEGFWWRLATYLFGGGAARQNGMEIKR